MSSSGNDAPEASVRDTVSSVDSDPRTVEELIYKDIKEKVFVDVDCKEMKDIQTAVESFLLKISDVLKQTPFQIKQIVPGGSVPEKTRLWDFEATMGHHCKECSVRMCSDPFLEFDYLAVMLGECVEVEDYGLCPGFKQLRGESKMFNECNDVFPGSGTEPVERISSPKLMLHFADCVERIVKAWKPEITKDNTATSDAVPSTIQDFFKSFNMTPIKIYSGKASHGCFTTYTENKLSSLGGSINRRSQCRYNLDNLNPFDGVITTPSGDLSLDPYGPWKGFTLHFQWKSNVNSLRPPKLCGLVPNLEFETIAVHVDFLPVFEYLEETDDDCSDDDHDDDGTDGYDEESVDDDDENNDSCYEGDDENDIQKKGASGIENEKQIRSTMNVRDLGRSDDGVIDSADDIQNVKDDDCYHFKAADEEVTERYGAKFEPATSADDGKRAGDNSDPQSDIDDRSDHSEFKYLKYLVPKMCSNRHGYCWKVSNMLEERDIITNSSPVHQEVYKLLKFLITSIKKQDVCFEVTSYMLKTTLFYHLRYCPETGESIKGCLHTMLRLLSAFYEVNQVPNFFNNVNLIKRQYTFYNEKWYHTYGGSIDCILRILMNADVIFKGNYSLREVISCINTSIELHRQAYEYALEKNLACTIWSEVIDMNWKRLGEPRTPKEEVMTEILLEKVDSPIFCAIL